MTNASAPKSEPRESPKFLRMAGGLLFAFGLLSYALVYTFDEASVQSLRLAAGVGVLVGLGYPALLYVRALDKIAALEDRIAVLERDEP